MPDYEGYTKSLEKILDGVTKDYWSSYIDINRHQVNVGKTYLWVSAALIGVYATGYNRFSERIIEGSCSLVLSILAFSLASMAFGICLYAIPARKGYKAIPNKGWGEFSNSAYQHLKSNNAQVYATLLTEHISKIDHAFAHNFKTNQSRARLLRFTSWVLIASFVIAVFAAGSVLLQTDPDTTQPIEEMKMSGDNEQEPTPEPTLQVPEPPPPADIGGGDVSTHSVDHTTTERTFITESEEKK